MDVNEWKPCPWDFVFWNDQCGLWLVLHDVRWRDRRLSISERTALLGVTSDWSYAECYEKTNS